MTYSFRKIKEYIYVQSMEDFISLINKISPQFFWMKFHKSKSTYLKEIKRLFTQIDHDFHFVWILKQEKYAFQLKWKESVLKAHLKILKEGVFDENYIQK